MRRDFLEGYQPDRNLRSSLALSPFLSLKSEKGGIGNTSPLTPFSMSSLMRDDYKYTYISTATTTQVATGNCRLIRINVNTVGAGTIGIIDGIAGTTVNVGQLAATSVGPQNYGVKLSTGLRIVTAAASDITVVWTPN